MFGTVLRALPGGHNFKVFLGSSFLIVGCYMPMYLKGYREHNSMLEKKEYEEHSDAAKKRKRQGGSNSPFGG